MMTGTIVRCGAALAIGRGARKHERSAALGMAALLWLCPIGCSDGTPAKVSGTGEDGPDAAVDGPLDAEVDLPLEGAPSEELFVEELCRKARPCCVAAGMESSTAVCHDTFDELRASSYYDATRARACLLQLRAISYDATGCPAEPLVPFCSDVFYARGGPKAPGDLCDENNGECAAAPGQRATCAANDGQEIISKVAHCHQVVPGKEGESCHASVLWYGDADPRLSVIQRPEAPALPAVGGRYCDVADGLQCDGQSDVCVRLPASGAPLALGEACSMAGAAVCEKGAHCASTSLRCEPKGDLDDPCLAFDPIGCHSTFCKDGRCAPAFGGLKLELVCGKRR